MVRRADAPAGPRALAGPFCAMTDRSDNPAPPARRPSRRWPWLLALLLVLLAVGWWWQRGRDARPAAPAGGRPGAMAMFGPAAVTAAVAKQQTVPVWLGALGTVTPHVLASVMPRVSGLLQSVDFHQGQPVRAGQLLATIDPRPFRIAVEQARAQREQTAAQLAGARGDLRRYETLLRQHAISAQQVADQRATVAQLKAQLDANGAALDNARLQLEWTRITAPVSGIAGLRQVDPGNMVGPGGAVGVSSATASTSASGSGQGAAAGATPIATIAQVQPIEVTFALPQAQVSPLLRQLAAGRHAVVQAWDASDSRMLAQGRLLAADNQISSSTGTLALRARFGNDSLSLYPNEFVNVRVLERSVADAVVVPSTAVGVGADGDYVYVIGADGKVTMRRVVTGVVWQGLTQVVSGIEPGARVVTAGLDHLRDGARVRVVPATPRPAATGGPAGKAVDSGRRGASAPAPRASR